jgi:hypothetical protein
MRNLSTGGGPGIKNTKIQDFISEVKLRLYRGNGIGYNNSNSSSVSCSGGRYVISDFTWEKWHVVRREWSGRKR